MDDKGEDRDVEFVKEWDEYHGEAHEGRGMRKPKAPTKKEMEEHLPTHLPYREWCPQCVAGQAIGIQHKSKGKDEEAIGITVSMDYCFLSNTEDDEEKEPVLVMYDDRTKAVWCVMTDSKGPLSWVVKWCVSKLEEAGYNGQEITIKTHREPALLSLKGPAIATRNGVTTPVESPVRQSKANGAMERTIRAWQGYMRTIKNYCEDKCEIKLNIEHVLFHWLVMWTADSMNMFKVHSTGRTSYEAMTGHRMRRKVLAFGEKIMFKMAPEKKKDKSESDWNQGIFVGMIHRTTEYVLMDKDGIYKTVNVKRFAEGSEYDAKCLEWARTPIDEFVNKGAKSRVRTTAGIPAVPRIEVTDREAAPRTTRFVKADFEKHEFTEGCPECIRLRTGLGTRKVHSEECRGNNARSSTARPWTTRPSRSREGKDSRVERTRWN